MRPSLAHAVLFCSLALCGCSSVPVFTSASAPTGPAGRAAITGRVHGGQNPISGAQVYLLAINSTGYGGPGIAPSGTNESASLLTTGTGQTSLGFYVTTDANGNFSVTGDYTCPQPTSTRPYFYAVGGNAGSGNNSAIALVGPVTLCPTSSESVVVNEATTIASAFAFAGIASDPTHASTSGSTLSEKNLNHQANIEIQLVDPLTGVAASTTEPGNGTIPQSEINTLANILAACVNSSSPSFTPCTTLFANAKNSSGVAPTDTATAALNIAQHPGANVANLFALQGSSPPFQPDLSAAPNDFTIAIAYTGGGLSDSNDVAIDASGNAWVTSSAGVSVFSYAGEAANGSSALTVGGVNAPVGIAIDGSGDAWVNNTGTASISEIYPSGSAAPGSPFTGGGLVVPTSQFPANGLAIDTSGDIWAVSSGSTVLSGFDSSGSPLSSSGYSGGGFAGGIAAAADAASDLWAPATSGISEFVLGPNSWSNHSPFDGGSVDEITGLAVDPSNNVWVANYGNSTISEFLFSSGSWSSNSPISGGGISSPLGLAIDGAGNIWVSNNGTNSISEFSSSGDVMSGSSGYTAASLSHVIGIAIDGSGNVWVASNTQSNDAITEFIGAAVPVVTPIVANLLSPYGSAAVNEP